MTRITSVTCERFLYCQKKGDKSVRNVTLIFQWSYIINGFVQIKTVWMLCFANIHLSLENDRQSYARSFVLRLLNSKTQPSACHTCSMKKRHFLTEKNAYLNGRVTLENVALQTISLMSHGAMICQLIFFHHQLCTLGLL